MGKKWARRLDRSAGPEDVRPGWLLDSAIRSIGPYIEHPSGEVADRKTGELLWKPGDPPEKRPRNPDPGAYDKPHTRGYFGGGGTGPLRRGRG